MTGWVRRRFGREANKTLDREVSIKEVDKWTVGYKTCNPTCRPFVHDDCRSSVSPRREEEKQQQKEPKRVKCIQFSGRLIDFSSGAQQ